MIQRKQNARFQRKQSNRGFEFRGRDAEGFWNYVIIFAEAKPLENRIVRKLGGSIAEAIWNNVDIPCGSKATVD